MRLHLPASTVALGLVVTLVATPSGAAQRAAARGSSQATGRSSDRGTPQGTAVPRGPDQPAAQPAPQPAPRGGDQQAAPQPSPRASGRDAEPSAPPASPREPSRPVGRAVPRTGPPPTRDGGDGVVVVPGGAGFFPWGFDYPYYGGYYGAYDPWYGWYPSYAPVASYSSGYDGALRLKVKPREASVYVDGYYAGIVDDFDGIFQRLHLDAGPHHLELQAPGYEPLAFDVRIEPDRTTTYRAEMGRLP